MAHRDFLLLYLGFYCLLRSSEIVTIKFSDFHFAETSGDSADFLFIAKSKMDQAKQGARIPLPQCVPKLGDIRELVDRHMQDLLALDWYLPDTYVMWTYTPKSKSIA